MSKINKEDRYSKWNSIKWYNNKAFSLIPIFISKEKDVHNTQNYLFKWLFVQAWTGDSFAFGFSVFFNSIKGIGFDIQLPYLYIDCSYRNITVVSKMISFLNRKSKFDKMTEKEKEEFFKKESEKEEKELNEFLINKNS